MPALPRPLQLHFPQYAPEDRSGQAARLHLDEAPPSTLAPPTTDAGKRDGLLQGAKSARGVEEETEQAYKRRGPANGLQRKNVEEELKLPPISQTDKQRVSPHGK
ncbi:PREDICTED: uncharacterized protein LOC106126655 [Papilio xuthus]|uniref:Uncharacterized protein LOC106126655 n=1 Tax=Papilio xuthus TaxID=66420 RepID=A0AAJ6ZV88_PAPXU|nr:PREDICTED: uncharacterized protein LOC106126655 [Papilio xuthus]